MTKAERAAERVSLQQFCDRWRDADELPWRLVEFVRAYERWKARRAKAKPRPKRGRMRQLSLFE